MERVVEQSNVWPVRGRSDLRVISQDSLRGSLYRLSNAARRTFPGRHWVPLLDRLATRRVGPQTDPCRVFVIRVCSPFCYRWLRDGLYTYCKRTNVADPRRKMAMRQKQITSPGGIGRNAIDVRRPRRFNGFAGAPSFLSLFLLLLHTLFRLVQAKAPITFSCRVAAIHPSSVQPSPAPTHLSFNVVAPT